MFVQILKEGAEGALMISGRAPGRGDSFCEGPEVCRSLLC